MKRHLASALALAATLLASLAAFGQEHPNIKKGFAVDAAYQMGDVDSVNVYNGNLVVTVPIGQKFPLSNALSFGFSLTYNSKVWDMENLGAIVSGKPGMRVRPSQRSNAGLGWLMSFGRILDVDHPANRSNALVYESPDGAEHRIYCTVHKDEMPVSSLCHDDALPVQVPPGNTQGYTRDGTYLRMRMETHPHPTPKHMGLASIEFPDGTRHYFEDDDDNRQMRMYEIQDRFGNVVHFDYPDALTWNISDSQGRTYIVKFEAPNDSRITQANYKTRLRSIEVPAFNGRRATYYFGYDVAQVHRGCIPDYYNYENVGEQYVPKLATITIPTGSNNLPTGNTSTPDPNEQQRYSFLYFDTHFDCGSGGIRHIDLPTGGTIDYDYQRYTMPTSVCTKDAVLNETGGVKSRIVKDLSRTPGTYNWTYKTEKLAAGGTDACQGNITLPNPPEVYKELRNTVTTPTGEVITHWFSIWPKQAPSSEGFKREEFGLPITHSVPAVNGRFLSTSTQDGNLKMKEYVSYELDPPAGDELIPSFDVDRNRRVNGSRTEYQEDGKHADVAYSDFDGLGHYRVVTMDGNYDGANDRTVTTTYNPGKHMPTGTFPMTPTIDHNATWILDTYTSRTAVETVPTSPQQTSTLKSEFCFNTSTGFLDARRTLKGASAANDDVLVLFEQQQGNVTKERYFGGDVKHTSGSGCAPATTNEQPTYEIVRDWDFGSIHTEGFTNAGFLSIDNDIDSNTGLPKRSRDAAGIFSDFTYDNLGRVKTVTPQAGHGPTFNYTYRIDSKSPSVEVKATAGSREVGRKFVRFDDLGRVWLEFTRMPTLNQWSVRQFEYDGKHRQTRISQPDLFTGDPVSPSSLPRPAAATDITYDYLGRQITIIPPDGAAHTITHSFKGISEDIETVKRANGTTNERAASTTRTYDRFGRLTKVEEKSGSTTASRPVGSPFTTDYNYDAADRLIEVKMNGDGGNQTRKFTYDGRGFLTREEHPEATSPTVYSDFDSRGHATKRTFAGKTLTFDYDEAERLHTVSDQSGVLKQFDFAKQNGTADGKTSFTKGKLTQASRRNDLTAGRVDVTEKYDYTEAAGQVSRRTTVVEKVNGSSRTPIQEFAYNLDYDDVLQPETITMPTCKYNCTTADGLASVHNTRTEGYLTSVDGYADITYHPTGMVENVQHQTPRKPIDKYAAKDNMARPSKITFTGCGNLTPYFLPGSIQVKPDSTSCGLQVTWPPAVTCGSGAGIKYKVERLDRGVLASCLTDVKYVDATAQPNVQYTYKITAEGPETENGTGGCNHGLTVNMSSTPTSFKTCAKVANLSVNPVKASIGITATFTANLSSENGFAADEELIFSIVGPNLNREIGRARTGATGFAILRKAIDLSPADATQVTVTYAGGALPPATASAALTLVCDPPAYNVKPLFLNALPSGTPANKPYSVMVATSARCGWQPFPDPGFLTVSPTDHKTGFSTFNVGIAANTSSSTRTSKVRVAFDQLFTDVNVEQSGTGCSFHFSPEVAYAPAESSFATGSIDVSAPDTCSWTIQSDQSWLHVTSPTGQQTGNATVRYTINDNPDPAKRVAYLILKQGGTEVARAAVNQDALPPAIMPVLVEDLQGGTVSNGKFVSLRVYVTGNQLKYRWFVDDIPQGECNGPACAARVFSGGAGYPGPGQSTSYQVQVYNNAGFVSSRRVTWTNTTPTGSTCHVPAISDSLFHGPTVPGDALSPRPGAPVTFFVVAFNYDAGDTSEIKYQWYHGLPGDTSSKVANGTTDTVTVNPFDTSFYWLEATNACGSQWSRSGSVTITDPPRRRRAVSHDMNGDGKSDVLWHNAATNQNELWVMNGINHASTVTLPASNAGKQMQSVGDLNADGKVDILWRDPQTGANEVWLMNRTNLSQVVPLEPRTGAGWTMGAVADYDNDGSDDIVWHNNNSGENELWFGNDTDHNGTWALPNSGASGLYGTGDFNGDEKNDLFFHDRNTGKNAIWIMDDAERSTVAAKSSSGLHKLKATAMAMPSMDTDFVPAEVADFDGDGRPDILWRNSTTGENKLWVMSGTVVSQTVDVETRSGEEWQIGGGGSNNSDDTGNGGGGNPGGGGGTTASTLTVTADPAPLGQATAATATLLSGTNPLSQREVVFLRSGNELGRFLTGPDGSATAVVDVAGLPAGSYPGAITVRFDGDATYAASSATTDLIITTEPPEVTWNNPAPIVYGTALSAAQLNATADKPGTFVYTPLAGTVLDAGYQTLSVTFTPTDPSFSPITRTATLLVTKAPSSVTWATPAPISYGKPLSALQLNAKSTLPGSFTYVPAPGSMLPVGTTTLNVTFDPDSANYESSSTTTTITVEKGAQLILWDDPAPITALVAIGPAQLNARVLASGVDPAGAVSYDPPAGTLLPPGQHELRVTVAATASYEAATASVDLLVTRVASALQWNNPAPIVYGTPLSAAQLNATANVPGVFTYDPPAGTVFNSGTERLSVTFTPNDDRYEPTTGQVMLQILKAPQTISWTSPAAIVYGTPLSSTQLNATVQVGGPAPASTLVYTPSEGTVLQAGAGQVLTVTAPATDNYDEATKSVSIDVLKANPVITWPAPAPIVYGTALSSTQLNATADVAGAFTYTPPAGTILNAGNGQTLALHFAPADAHNYNSADATRTIDVAKAQQTLTWTAPAPIVYGTALSAAQLNATVQVVGPAPAGALTYNPVLGTMLNAGPGQTLTVSAAETANYQPATKSVSLDVLRAPLTLVADAKSKVYGSPNPPLTGTLTGVVNNDPITASYATTATQQSGAGTYAITPSLNDPNNRLPNYNVTITPATLTIIPAQLTIAANPASKQYSDPVPAFTATFTGFVLGETPAVLAGTLSITTPADAASGPGTYPMSIGGLSSNNYTITYIGSTLTVTAEDARVTITTPALIAASVSGPTTTVTLTATVRDISVTADANGDTFPGDIRKATLTFVDRATNATLCTASLGLLSTTDQRTAIGTCSFTRDFGTTLPASLTVGATVGGFYTRNAAADDLALSIVAPTTDRIMGNVKMTVASAAGPYAPDAGSEAQVDFNFQYKEKGSTKQKELDATFKVTFDKTDAGKKHRYSLSVDTASLAIRRTAAGGQGLVTGTGTLVDDTDKTTVATGVPFMVTATDNGNDDQLGFVLFKADGGLFVATGWNGAQMVELPTRNGQIKVEYGK